MLNHNKKRNVGLLSEFFAKYIANALVSQRHSDIDKAKLLYSKYFSGNSEISKELKFFNTLYNTRVTSREVASGLITKIKQLCEHETKNIKKLEDEKTKLLHEISLVLSDKEFFNRPVPDYKIQGAIQVLLNSWKSKILVENLGEIASLEDLVIEHISSGKTSIEPVTAGTYLEMTNQEIDSLVVGIMTEKFNSRFSKDLTDEQRKIISTYAFCESPEQRAALSLTLGGLREKTLTLIENTLTNKKIGTEQLPDFLGKKLTEVKSLLCGKYKDVSVVSDDSMAFYMTLVKLEQELGNN